MAHSKDVAVDTTMTNLVRAYRYEDQTFIADMVAPVKPVRSKAGRYKTRGKEALEIDVSDEGDDRSRTNELGFDVGEVTYYANTKRLKGLVTDEEIQDFGLIDSRQEMTILLMHGIKLRQEIRIRNQFDGGGSGTNTVTIGTDWDTSTTVPADIATNKGTFMLQGGMPATHIVLPEHVANEVTANANLRGMLQDTDWNNLFGFLSDGRALEGRKFMGLTPVIPNVMYNSADRGQTRSVSYVWGDNAYLCRVDNQTRSGSFMVQIEALAPTVVRWRDNDPGGFYYKIMMKRAEKELTAESVLELADVT